MSDLDLTDVVLEIADSYDIPGTVGRRLAEAVADEVERLVRERIAAAIEAEHDRLDMGASVRPGLILAARVARGGVS